MATTGGFGVTFNIGSAAVGSAPVYTEIAHVEEINGVEVESLMSELTGHDSSGGYREVIPSGMFTVGDVEITLAFDITESTHANAGGGVMHAFLNKTKLAYQVVFPDSGTTTWTFDAYVKKVKQDSAKAEHLKAVVTFGVTGQPTLA